MTGDGVRVFGAEGGGHRPAYVRLRAEWVSARHTTSRVVFAVSGRLLERLLREDDFDLRRQAGCQVAEIAPAAADACCHGPLHRRSFARLRLMTELASRVSAHHVISLFLDPLQLALALQRRLPGHVTVSGILFRPSGHQLYAPTLRSSLGERLRDQRKLLLYRLMLRNPALTAVLSLDPYFPAFARNEFGGGHKVRALPDPVVTATTAIDRADIGADLRESVHGRELVFTLFGALAERKGVLQLLDALSLLPGPARATLRVVLAGKVEPAIAGELVRRVESLHGTSGAADCVRVVDRLLTTPELAWLVSRSDVILAPYQRFVGSSGVLGWAAEARKLVIAQDYGLVGALVRDYRLGLAVDSTSPARLAEAMSQLAEPGRLGRTAAAARWDEFLADRRPATFAAQVFAGLLPAEGSRS
jgi:glycosyltransferase involved in cell wall biosynthesis